jgi:small subunit ribosomal protein S1
VLAGPWPATLGDRNAADEVASQFHPFISRSVSETSILLSDDTITPVSEASEASVETPIEENPEATPVAESPFGTFDDEGNYIPRKITSDDLGMSFADAIDGTMVEIKDGMMVNGIVVKIDKDEVLLDIGYKSEGVIPSRELSIRNDVDPSEVVSMGESVEALVLTMEDKEGRLLLSKKRAQYERAWGDIEAKKEADEVVSGPVIEVVKGGLIVDIGLRGFLPASLVELRRVRDLAPYIGTQVHAKIIELDKNRNNVVLSRRAYLEENQKETRDQFLTNLKVGEIREGTVSSVVSFGAFVDLGGMDGLIHVSELSWKHVDHPGSVVTVGDPVKVQVLDVDFSRERISLSLKATQQDPWQEFAEGHQVGQLVYGRVTKLVQFGAFVQVGDGIEGLVHISEMSAHHVDSPEQVVTPGEELWVKIIDLDLARRRISLSIKQAAEGGELAAEYREHFEVDTEGNYVQGEASAEAEAAWTEYYGEGGEGEGTEAPTGAPTVVGEVAAALAAAGGAIPAEETPAEAATEDASEEAPAEAAAEEATAAE